MLVFGSAFLIEASILGADYWLVVIRLWKSEKYMTSSEYKTNIERKNGKE